MCVWGGQERENRLSVWLNSKIAFSPSGSASTDVSFRPHGRATLKSAPVRHNSAPLCAKGEKLSPLFTAHPPPPSSNPRPHVSRRNNWGGPCPELGRCGRSTEWAVNPVPLNPLGGWSSSLPSPCLSHTHALSSPPLLSAISSSTRPGLMLLPGLCDVAIGGPERKPDMGFSAGLVGPEETRSTGGGGGRSGPRGACQ